MNTTPYLLNDEEIKFLQQVYLKRRNLLLPAYIGIAILMVLSFFRTFSHSAVIGSKGSRSHSFGAGLSDNYISALVWLLAFIAVTVFFIRMYNKKIASIQKDINEQSGIIEYFQIENKVYHNLVNQYYFYLDNPQQPTIEVIADIYAHFQMGDYFPLKKAKHSGLAIFDSNYELF